MKLLALVITYMVLSTAGLLLVRSGLHAGAGSTRAELAKPQVIFGLIFYVASFGIWLVALKRYQLSSVYPLFIGVGYTAVVISSAVLLHERITPLKAAGILLVGAGVLLLVK
jgi:multidrug transporter EmrE-like cation transporter